MKRVGKAIAKGLFGAKYEGLTRSLLICLVVFGGLRMAGWRVPIAPSVLYLTVNAFTAGVMWQALSAEGRSSHMQNLFMLPFISRELVASYVAALGAYALLTKTASLLAVLLAVSAWSGVELAGAALCAVNAVLTAAAIYSLDRRRYVGCLWAAAVAAAVLCGGSRPWFIPALLVSGTLAAAVLYRADGYSFYQQGRTRRHAIKGRGRGSVQRYLLRYLLCHKNYLVNTAAMWCAACVLPLFLGQAGGPAAAPVGFAVLSLNTPICILLSCDPALEQAVRFLPGQKGAFCVPYCLFIAFCNLAADGIFLCSWQIQNGGVTPAMLAAAVFFALQSAICSVLLEWFYPLRGWKIERDLWHHPRKYIVPAAMLLLAGAMGALPALLPALPVLLAAEAVILILHVKRT